MISFIHRPLSLAFSACFWAWVKSCDHIFTSPWSCKYDRVPWYGTSVHHVRSYLHHAERSTLVHGAEKYVLWGDEAPAAEFCYKSVFMIPSSLFRHVDLNSFFSLKWRCVWFWLSPHRWWMNKCSFWASFNTNFYHLFFSSICFIDSGRCSLRRPLRCLGWGLRSPTSPLLCPIASTLRGPSAKDDWHDRRTTGLWCCQGAWCLEVNFSKLNCSLTKRFLSVAGGGESLVHRWPRSWFPWSCRTHPWTRGELRCHYSWWKSSWAQDCGWRGSTHRWAAEEMRIPTFAHCILGIERPRHLILW